MGAATRSFIPPDQASLHQAIDAVCAEGAWMSTPCFEPTPAWNHALDTPACARHQLLVVFDKDQVVGWCRLFPAPDCPGLDSQAEVGIGLLPDYRGRGLGQALLTQALGWAAGNRFEQVTLTTRADNARAIRLFERCGFTIQNHRIDSWLDMACHLPSPGGYPNER